MTVLPGIGRAREADGLYVVVSQSGREYLVEPDQGACECDDHRYRGETCKHVRRVRFSTGRRAIPVRAAVELDVDPDLGEHVGDDLRYVSTDGGAVDAGAHTGGAWAVRDRDRGKRREFDSRARAETAMRDLEDLGLNVELVPPGESVDGSEQTELPTARDADDVEQSSGDVDPGEYDLDGRTVAVDPMTWIPDEFVDWIDGTPAINRKGFEVLGHFYDVDVETEVQVGPADTDFEYCQVKATATTAGGRRCEALGSAHVDRGDDPKLLLEYADTRARKRALSIATGVGAVAVEELKTEAAE